jgi:hypothetical protein
MDRRREIRRLMQPLRHSTEFCRTGRLWWISPDNGFEHSTLLARHRDATWRELVVRPGTRTARTAGRHLLRREQAFGSERFERRVHASR